MVTFQFVPYQQIQDLSSAKRINKLLNIVKQDKIVLLEGRLNKQEEADLIEITMEEIDDRFKGIELSVIYPQSKKDDNPLRKLRNGMMNLVLGDRNGFTIIGPASVIKRIERNPNKIELFTEERRNGKRRR